MEQVVRPKIVEEQPSKLEIAARVIAIIAFSLVMSALAAALITDIVLLVQQIVLFFVACVGAVAVFIMGFFLMMLSCILIFGVYILENQGFWPATWAKQAFNSVLSDAKLTPNEINVIINVRIMLLISCIVVFILSIIALVFYKVTKKKNKFAKQKVTKPFSIISLIFSILGIFAAAVVIMIMMLIKK